jgi:hypothetical protein
VIVVVFVIENVGELHFFVSRRKMSSLHIAERLALTLRAHEVVIS